MPNLSGDITYDSNNNKIDVAGNDISVLNNLSGQLVPRKKMLLLKAILFRDTKIMVMNTAP